MSDMSMDPGTRGSSTAPHTGFAGEVVKDGSAESRSTDDEGPI